MSNSTRKKNSNSEEELRDHSNVKGAVVRQPPFEDWELLTEKEVANALNVAKSTLQNWRYQSSSKGPDYIKIGNAVRYLWKDVREYRDRRHRQSTSEDETDD